VVLPATAGDGGVIHLTQEGKDSDPDPDVASFALLAGKRMPPVNKLFPDIRKY
jgi:hypothetical protein